MKAGSEDEITEIIGIIETTVKEMIRTHEAATTNLEANREVVAMMEDDCQSLFII